jgi:hypothetical protein
MPDYLGGCWLVSGLAGTCFHVAPDVLVMAWHVLEEIDASKPGSVAGVDPLGGGMRSLRG